ncbi:MAG: hypothetical protein WED06_01230 [Candidatus Paceibacterota bacterium]
MSKESPGCLELFFAPLDSLKFSKDTPVLVFGFEEQDDPGVAKHFPEMESRRKSIDNISLKGDETVTLQSILRDGEIYHAGLIYIPFPWRKKREINATGTNFLREVFCSVKLAVQRLKSEKFKKFSIVLPNRFSPQNVKDKQHREHLYEFVKTVVEAIVYGNNVYDEHKEKDSRAAEIEEATFLFFGEEDKALDGFFRKAISDGEIVGRHLARTKQLIQIAPNFKNPVELVSAILAKESKAEPSKEWRRIRISARLTAYVLRGKAALKHNGFELIHAVHQGSETEPCLLRLHYKPKTDRQKRVKKLVLTGKGVVYDTGGYDLKLTDYYDNMHFDMAGAAVSMAALFMAEEFNLPVELIAIAPIVENKIGPGAVVPGTILKAYGGKTVKIINTDSEGRLLMAEAIAYGQEKFKPDAMITVATLGDLSEFGPDFLKVGYVGRGNKRKVELASKLSAEKVLFMPEMEMLNRVDIQHAGWEADLVNDIDSAFHTAPFVFLYNFFKEELSWFFVDVSAIFESDAQDYGAGPGFGQKFVWHLIQQYS